MMKNRCFFVLAACLFLLLGIGFSAPAMSADANRPGFTQADAEYFLPDNVFLLIQPGVDIEIIDFTIPPTCSPR
jgi:hypothetical protein